MIDLFSDYALHFERYFLLSRQGISIIEWCLTGLALLYAVSFHPKVNRRTAFFYAGIILRLILFSGLSFELTHQMKAAQFSNLYIDQQSALMPLMQFLLFGYILLVSFHYMMTLEEKGGKGLFFTFDIAVMTMPFFQIVFSFAAYWKENGAGLDEWLYLLVLFIAAPILAISLFFRLYWKSSGVFLLIFYFIIIGGLIFIKRLGDGVFPLSLLLTLLGFLMTYRLLDGAKKPYRKVKRFFAAGTAVFFTALLNPFYNAADAAFSVSSPQVSDIFDANIAPLSQEQAEQVVRSFFPTDGFIYLTDTNQDVHNIYHFKTKDYEAEVDGVAGTIANYKNLNAPQGRTLSDQAYIERSIRFLEKRGRVLAKHIKAKASKEDGSVNVQIYPESEDPDVNSATLVWQKETLMYLSEDASVYSLKTIKHIRFAEKDIKRNIETIYRKLDMPMPSYQLTDVDLTFGYSLHYATVKAKTKDGTEMSFDPTTGGLTEIAFKSKKALPYRVKELETRLLSLFHQDPSRLNRVKGEDGSIDFQQKTNRSLLKAGWIMTKNEEGPFVFLKRYDALPDEKPPYTYADGNKAFQKAADLYQKGMIYYKRTKLVIVSDKGTSRYAWLVIIQSFGSNEHDAYLVDAKTYEVKNLYDN